MPAPASAQPVATFSSPLLASVDRLVSRVGSLVDSPQFASRSLRFADHILSLRLPGSAGSFGSSGFGGFGGFGAPAGPHGPTEIGPRADGSWAAQASGQAAPWSMLLPTPWIPSAEALRGGRVPSRQQPVVAAPSKSAPSQAVQARPVAPAPTAGQPVPVMPQLGAPTATLPLVAPELRSDENRAPGATRSVAAPAPVLPSGAAPIASVAEALPETRVRDWLAPMPAPIAGPLAPELAIPTPLARSFGHLIWSDLRLLHSPSAARELTAAASPQLPVAPSLQAPAVPPVATVRAAAPASLPMVRALDLVPESTQRPSAAVSRREDALSTRAQLPREPVPAPHAPAQSGPPALDSGAAQLAPVPAQPATATSLPATEPAPRVEERPPVALPFVAAASAERREQAVAAPRAPLAPVLSPSLFASPALGAPTPGGSLLALAASAFPAAVPAAVPGLQIERSASPWPTLGGLATSVERFATSVGSRAAGASAGLGNPFGGVDSWRAAPGVPAVLLRSLGETQAPTAPRAVPELALPFISAPRSEAAASVQRQPAALTLPRPLVATSTSQPAQPVEILRPASGALPSTPSVAPASPIFEGQPLASAPPLQAQGAVAAPWRQVGGLAALAELFAAGVGLTTGAAGGVAQQAGVASGAPLLPSWFPRSLGVPVTEAAAPSTSAPARVASLPSLVMPAPAWPAAAGAAPRVARGVVEPRTVTPSGSAYEAAIAPVAARSPLAPTVAPSAAPVGPLWNIAGGLAATAESFARDRGVAAAAVDLVPRTPTLGESAAGPAPGRWLPLGGGMVFVPAPRAPQSVSAVRPEASPMAAPAARTAVEAPALAPVPRPFIAAPERAIPEAGVLSVGGIGLRSELFTAGLAAPSQGAASLATWASAPGLSPPLAQALGARAAEATTAGGRWAVGERGLVFVSGPQPEPAPTARTLPPPLGRPTPATPVAAASAPTAATQPASAPALPWLAAGGTATLAELFATGVVLGSGAASGLAERAGVASSPSGMTSWMGAPLLNLLSTDSAAAVAQPAATSERAARPALTLDWVQPERAPSVMGTVRPQRTSSVPQPIVAPTLASQAARPSEVPTERPAQLTLQAQAGGLAASAEAFARDHGIAPSSPYLAVSGGTAAEAAPRFVPLAGGLVMIRPEAPGRPMDRSEQQPAAARRISPSLPTVEAARSAPERSVSWQQAGGVGARSELFALTLGPTPTEAGASLGGWGEQPLLTSLPRETAQPESAPTARFGWSGPGGLVFLAPQLRPEAPTARPGTAARGLTLSAPAWAERLAPAASRESTVAAEAAPQRVAPSLTMLSAERLPAERAAPSSERRSEVAALQQRYARGILTSFPTENRASVEDEQIALPPTQLQPQTVEQISRLSQLLGQLAQGSGTRLPKSVTAAWELSGAPGMPLWQRLQPELTQLATSLDSADEEDAGDEPTPMIGAGARRPSMTMVQGTGARAPRSQPAQAPSAPSPQRPKTPEAAVSAAMASVAQSGGAAAASVRVLEALRSQVMGQGGRSDDRIALDDLTMVAISVGQNKMAAATNTAYSQVSATAESLVGHPNPPNVPDDEHAASQKVEAMAERVVKKLLDEDQLESERYGVA